MANGTLKVSNIQTSSGSGTITLGQSGETIALGSGVTSKLNQPAFLAILSTTTNLTDATDTKVTFDTEDFDTDNAYDTSTGEFTIPVAGKYCVYFSVFPKADGNGRFERGRVQVIRERSGVSDLTISSAEEDARSNPGRGADLSATVVQEFNVGDKIYVNVYNDVNAGTPQVIGTDGGAYFSFFGAYRIGVS